MLLNVSVKGQYALQAILDLALRPQGIPIKIADVAARQAIPQKFLELILASLKQGGFVESRRGAEGGYLLARPADSIKVGEVIRFVEGKRTRAARRSIEEDTPFSDLWHQVDDAVSSVIDQQSFGDLARTWQEKQSQAVPSWDI
jgi:Rrf2 family transcriptional regulator, cysteine metabolism repressor